MTGLEWFALAVLGAVAVGVGLGLICARRKK
jgi:ABC-type proline/glycine betaine transport system permease subunit